MNVRVVPTASLVDLDLAVIAARLDEVAVPDAGRCGAALAVALRFDRDPLAPELAETALGTAISLRNAGLLFCGPGPGRALAALGAAAAGAPWTAMRQACARLFRAAAALPPTAKTAAGLAEGAQALGPGGDGVRAAALAVLDDAPAPRPPATIAAVLAATDDARAQLRALAELDAHFSPVSRFEIWDVAKAARLAFEMTAEDRWSRAARATAAWLAPLELATVDDALAALGVAAELRACTRAQRRRRADRRGRHR